MITPAAQAVLDELNELVAVDGATLEVRAAEGSRIELALDLTASSCPECVLPREMLVDLLAARLATADPDITDVRLQDPREDGAGPV